MTDLNLIARKLEEATGTDREIDWCIFEAAFDEVPDFHGCQLYTESVDAALALVERVLPGSDYVLVGVPGDRHAYSASIKVPFSTEANAAAATLPLAICLALIRALIAKEGR